MHDALRGRRTAWWMALAAAALALLVPLEAAAEEPGDLGDQYNDKALRYVRARKPDKALDFFEKALPYRNDSSDIFYNLVAVAEAVKDWSRVHLYTTGFLYLESGTDDARDFARKQKAAVKGLTKAKLAPAPVSFEIDPPGVEIFVNHVPVGKARRGMVDLPPGEYVARASKVDHHDWEQPFEVVAGTPAVVKGALQKMVFHGLLSITTEPAEGVQVFVDDELIGTTPIEEPLKLETRRYLVRFEKEGWERWIRYVDIKKDEAHELKPALEKASEP